MVVRKRELNEKVRCEIAADKIFKEKNLFGRRHSIHTNLQLVRRIKIEDLSARRLFWNAQQNSEDEELERLYLGLAKLAGLDPLSLEVFRMHLFGVCIREIAFIFRTSKSKAFRIVKRSARALRKAYKKDPYAGWYDVYQAETKRR